MGFLETCAALLAFVTIGGIVGYFSSGEESPPEKDAADDMARPCERSIYEAAPRGGFRNYGQRLNNSTCQHVDMSNCLQAGEAGNGAFRQRA